MESKWAPEWLANMLQKYTEARVQQRPQAVASPELTIVSGRWHAHMAPGSVRKLCVRCMNVVGIDPESQRVLAERFQAGLPTDILCDQCFGNETAERARWN